MYVTPFIMSVIYTAEHFKLLRSYCVYDGISLLAFRPSFLSYLPSALFNTRLDFHFSTHASLRPCTLSPSYIVIRGFRTFGGRKFSKGKRGFLTFTAATRPSRLGISISELSCPYSSLISNRQLGIENSYEIHILRCQTNSRHHLQRTT